MVCSQFILSGCFCIFDFLIVNIQLCVFFKLLIAVHPGQQMMPQQGPLPPRMNMANGSHGNPMNPNMMPGNLLEEDFSLKRFLYLEIVA